MENPRVTHLSAEEIRGWEKQGQKSKVDVSIGFLKTISGP
jgi:hypothetical protein